MLIRIAAVLAVVVAVAAALVVWRFAIFVLPFGWTGEAERLSARLRVAPGQTVADIGAGDGALAVEMAARVGPGGTVYATEIAADRRQAIAARVAAEGRHNVRIVEATASATQLPDDCCDAIYLRTVLHHVDDKRGFARALARALRAGGRLAIIDFPPGAIWFHGAEHGVSGATVIGACGEAGLQLIHQVNDWGGGTYLLVFERP